MHCKSGWIRFLNRFATHPVEGLVANWANSLQIYYFSKRRAGQANSDGAKLDRKLQQHLMERSFADALTDMASGGLAGEGR